MNQYLFGNDVWNTPYYFYCDKDCNDFFRTIIKGKNSVMQVDPTENL